MRITENSRTDLSLLFLMDTRDFQLVSETSGRSTQSISPSGHQVALCSLPWRLAVLPGRMELSLELSLFPA